MDLPLDSGDEIRRLQRCINDLVSVLALPAIWKGGEPSQVARTLLDALLGMLRLDLVYVRLKNSDGDPPLEAVRLADSSPLPPENEVREILHRWVADDYERWPALLRRPLGDVNISIVPFGLGMQGEFGVVVAGSLRPDFPEQTEKLVLSVAANQAAIGLQQAWLIGEQKRVAAELDQRVAQRTSELAQANLDLRKEVAERRLAEARLRREEKELRRSEARSAAILTAALDCIITIDHEGRITEFNPASESTFGYRRSDVVGKNLADLIIPPRFRERHRQGLALHLSTGEKHVLDKRVEMTAMRADGSEFPVELAVSRISIDGPPAFTAYLRDITARKRAENALRASELYWRQTVDGIPGLMVTMTATGEIELPSRQTLDYFGKTHEELKNWAHNDSVHADDRASAIAAWRHSIETASPYNLDQRLRRADGEYRWFNVRALAVRDAEDRVHRWYVLLTDIDDRKRAEEALRASERDLTLNINAMPTLLASARPDGSGDFFNQRWLDYTGLSAEQLQDSGWTTPLHPDDAPGLLESWRTSLLSGAPLESEARMRRFDGAYRWLLFRANALRDDSGHIVKWYGTAADIDERKQAEEKLRRSEADLLEAQRLTHTGSWKHDIPSGKVIVSPEIHQIFASNSDEDTFSPNFWFDRIHPDDRQRVQELFQKCETEKCPYEAHYRLLLPDGSIRHQHAIGRPVFNDSGELLEFAGTAMDVTEQVQARIALQKAFDEIKKSEHQLRAVTNAIPILAWSAHPDGSIDFYNQRWLDYTGLSAAAQAQGWGWTELIHRDDLPGLMQHWESCLASGSLLQAEARMRRFDGAYRWFLFRANALRDEAGNILRWYGTNTDIDDRKRAEEQLRRSETFLAEGQNLGRIGNFSWRVAADELTWSEQLYRIFEFEPGTRVTLELIGSRVHPEDIPLMADMIERARGGVSDFEYQHRLLMPDRSVKYITMVAHGIRDEHGEFEYIGAAQDVTQRRLAEEALDKARSELAHVARVTSLGVLTASIAHEVNQPLAGIITNASTCLRMLGAEPPNLEGARETVRRTIRDGNRASDVIARLRALFSKKKELAAEPVDLNEAAREVIALCLNELQSNCVVLRPELDDDLPAVIGDRVQLQEVILNLVRNASDAMAAVDDRPRQLLIRTARDEDNRVRLSIQDAGVGLDPQIIDRLFEAFYTTKVEGMGVGLSVSRSIIEKHHGRLWATPNDGPGATFSFSIPCAATAGSGAETIGPVRSSTAAAGNTMRPQ